MINQTTYSTQCTVTCYSNIGTGVYYVSWTRRAYLYDPTAGQNPDLESADRQRYKVSAAEFQSGAVRLPVHTTTKSQNLTGPVAPLTAGTQTERQTNRLTKPK